MGQGVFVGGVVNQIDMASQRSQMADIRALVETAPDSVLRSLRNELIDCFGDLAPVIDKVIDEEWVQRVAAYAVFQPYQPMFSPRGDKAPSLVLSRAMVLNIWRHLRNSEGKLVNMAINFSKELRGGQAIPPCLDQLCASTAKLLRTEPAAVLDKEDLGLADRFCELLDLSRPARRGVPLLVPIVNRSDAQAKSQMRLLFKEVQGFGLEAPAAIMEIFYAHFRIGARAFKLIATVLERHTEQAVMESPFAPLIERIVTHAEGRIRALAAEDLEKALTLSPNQILDIEIIRAVGDNFFSCFTPIDQGEWSARISRLDARLDAILPDRFRYGEAAI